ncbi:nitroreductase family protein [Telmatobacter bradus]|uniref:nitroreductase family protein n=1 Tax=Telmatobacter bradus TaxID=474953 RepID=UPI003B4352D7
MSLSASEVHELKKAPIVEGVVPSLLERWSARAFADRAVSDEVLGRIFEATRWSASAYNEQPWRFIAGHKGSETFDKILSSLIGFNQEWAGKAPILIVGLAKTEFSHNSKPNPYAMYDLGAATTQLTVQAAAEGLTTHQMAGFEADKARTLLAIPAEYQVGIAVALGYQGEPAELTSEQLLSLETSPRQRKPLNELVFSAWSKPANLG